MKNPLLTTTNTTTKLNNKLPNSTPTLLMLLFTQATWRKINFTSSPTLPLPLDLQMTCPTATTIKTTTTITINKLLKPLLNNSSLLLSLSVLLVTPRPANPPPLQTLIPNLLISFSKTLTTIILMLLIPAIVPTVSNFSQDYITHKRIPRVISIKINTILICPTKITSSFPTLTILNIKTLLLLLLLALLPITALLLRPSTTKDNSTKMFKMSSPAFKLSTTLILPFQAPMISNPCPTAVVLLSLIIPTSNRLINHSYNSTNLSTLPQLLPVISTMKAITTSKLKA